MGRTWPKYMGWPTPAQLRGLGSAEPVWTVPPLFTCYVNSGGVAGMKQEKKEGEKGWPAMARWRSCWRRQATALVVPLAVCGGRRWLSLSLFFVLFSASSSSSSFSFGIPPLFCSLSYLLLLSLCSFSPCFYRQKTGEKEDGAATMLPLLQHVESFGQVRVLGRRLFDALEEEKSVKTKEEKIFFFPCFARLGEEKYPQCRSKRHCFGLFFLMNSVWNGAVLDKTRHFI